MGPSIRTIHEGEFAAFLRVNESAFGAVPSDEDVQRERSLARLDRCFVAADGEDLVGTAAVFEMPMAVPGGEVDVGYVSCVGVAPTHRRRGIATQLLRRQLEDARERGEAVDVLYASEGAIYGRFGYGLATVGYGYDADPTHTGFGSAYEPSGSMRLVEHEDAVKEVMRVHEAVRPGRPGMVALDAVRLDYTFHDHGPDHDLPRFFAVHEGVEGVDGYVIYRVKHDWPGSIPASVLSVLDLQATNPGAEADLWRFVFDVDLVGHVRAWSRPIDDALLHLVDEPRRLRATLKDNLWLRIVDVPEALRARRYAADGVVVLEVHDAFGPWNDGRYAIEVDAGAADVRRVADEPDLVASAADVAAAYLGGTSFRELQRAARVQERTAGALRRLDTMFGWDPAPWCPYVF